MSPRQGFWKNPRKTQLKKHATRIERLIKVNLAAAKTKDKILKETKASLTSTKRAAIPGNNAAIGTLTATKGQNRSKKCRKLSKGHTEFDECIRFWGFGFHEKFL